MTEIQPIASNLVGQAPINNATKADVKEEKIDEKSINSSGIDCTQLYTQKELSDIMKRIGKDCKVTVPQYEATYNKELELLVINNKSMTNDTLEIHKDGSAKHVGSWHNDDVAKPGELLDVIEDAKKRIDNENK